MNKKKKPVALVILDGWGYSPKTKANAVYQAHPECFNYLWNTYPYTTLDASGPAVGLPKGFAGNSEVGHTTIGAGQIIEQPLSFINKNIQSGMLCSNPVLTRHLKQLKEKNGRLHLIGLLSDGGVHSHQEHLYKLIRCAHSAGIKNIFIHAFLDGRDTPPQSAQTYLEKLEAFCKKYGCIIGSMSGRLYGMDRDENWERTDAVLDLLTKKQRSLHSWQKELAKNYAAHRTDEFIPPVQLDPNSTVEKHDGIILFNYRPDRMRQLTSRLLDTALPAKKRTMPAREKPHFLWLISMTPYHKKFTSPTLFNRTIITNTLLDQLKQKGLSIFTIAETEKYAHVTYFFSGGREVKRTNEQRVLVPSTGKATYKDEPKMSADEITQNVLESLEKNPKDFYLINYANADMVGHSGNLESTMRAITCVDKQLEQLYKAFIKERNGTLYITADHGNAEQMWNEELNCPHTEHTTNKVPFIFVSQNAKLLSQQCQMPKKLSEIAPFILCIFNNNE